MYLTSWLRPAYKMMELKCIYMAYVDLVLCQAMYLNSENLHFLKQQILLLVSVDWMPVINFGTRWWSCIVTIRVLEM
jgi:hypothetical protein